MPMMWLRMGQFLIGGVLSVVLLGSLGCGGGGGGGGGSTVYQQPTGSGPGTVRIENASNETVYYIYMSPTSQSTWGPDLLGSNVLNVGQAFTLSNIQPGVWDIRVVDQSRNYKEWRQVNIQAGGGYTLTVSGGGWARGG